MPRHPLRSPRIVLASWCILFSALHLQAQPGSSVELKKPAKYEKQTLASERTSTAKFGVVKKVLQNTYSHYNFFFNANQKLEQVLDRARAAAHDNYSALLPFYDYSPQAAARDSAELDSVVYKCTAGILLHDLRTDWVDDLYLLMGKAYFFKQDYDSASRVFHYVNYAFAKKDGDYDLPIGSNESGTGGIFSVSTQEKKKLIGREPARNEALLWLCRNEIESGEQDKAAGLLQILRNDPLFPERLRPFLEETIAYLFYTDHIYDSSANHLVLSFSLAGDRQQLARKEFLAGQLFQLAGKTDKASALFEKSASHALDPLLEVNAILSSIRVNALVNSGKMEEKRQQLLKLAAKDRYRDYRGIAYYAAAQIDLALGQRARAHEELLKSTRSFSKAGRDEAFMMLAGLEYEGNQYIDSHQYYDSVSESGLNTDAARSLYQERRPALAAIAANMAVINFQDSVQRLALLPEAAREKALRDEVRRRRRLKGLAEETAPNLNPALTSPAPQDLFAQADAGEFYFNSPSARAAGFDLFRQKWGDRPNADNWRRAGAISAAARVQSQVRRDSVGLRDTAGSYLSYDALLGSLPISEEKRTASNRAISDALYGNAAVFQDQLGNYEAAIRLYKDLLARYPDYPKREEALFNLYYDYYKLGRTVSADSVKRELGRQFPQGKWYSLLNGQSVTVVSNPATAEYERVYDLFVSGRFQEAQQARQHADSAFGQSFWTPQLLYIEAVYYINQRQDSIAQSRLGDIGRLFPSTPLAEKAATLSGVLARRTQIEDYLTKLEVTRNTDESYIPRADSADLVTVLSPRTVLPSPPASVKLAPAPGLAVRQDTAAVVANKFVYRENDPAQAIVLLDQVDPVFVSEARNAFNRFNAQYHVSDKLGVSVERLNDRYQYLVIGPFPNAALALIYIDQTKPVTATRIVPWLQASKYQYLILSDHNKEVLQAGKDIDGYRDFLRKALPGKF